MEVSWPTLPLAGHFVLEPSTCQRTSLYQLQNTEDPSLTVLWLMKPSHSGGT